MNLSHIEKDANHQSLLRVPADQPNEPQELIRLLPPASGGRPTLHWHICCTLHHADAIALQSVCTLKSCNSPCGCNVKADEMGCISVYVNMFAYLLMCSLILAFC